jgi:hypothetical protein
MLIEINNLQNCVYECVPLASWLFRDSSSIGAIRKAYTALHTFRFLKLILNKNLAVVAKNYRLLVTVIDKAIRGEK